MKKTLSIYVVIFITLLGFISCKKHHHHHNAAERNVENLSGVYQVKSLIGNYNGVDHGERLSDCEKNDEMTLNSSLTAKLTDVNTVCNPRSDDTGSWYLSNDSLILSKTFGGFLDGGKIKSFDGKTLVLFYNLETNYTVTATWVKK